ncbi:putative ribose-5-phosphate isomerase 4, chloroplastic isoform X2 [Iris pallida]|uniref:ribose-5-phosphate isomerase n=1 Tax=Iris pallida TaxID=29817 RepID=A0AAX6GXD5_IRIPA|nr:putative ribose-5-phosphate isomerase 4, chloroplastic isoform X2 [Iris pallida]
MAHASACFFSLPHHTLSSSRRNIHSSNQNIPARPPSELPVPIARAASDGSVNLLHAAKRAVDSYVTSGMVVGLGSGRASFLAIQHLGRRLRDGSLRDVTGIPTSVSSASEAAKAGIPLEDYRDSLQIDFAFMDADIIEEDTLAAVIGRRKLEGGESIIQEKSVMKTASNLTFIVPDKQYGKGLDGSIPVLVNTGNWMETAEEIDDLFLGDAEVWRRPTFGHADPHGGNFPLVTSEGHHVLDVIFTSPILDLAQVAKDLDRIDGVVDHGVISSIPSTAIVVSKTGVTVVNNIVETT